MSMLHECMVTGIPMQFSSHSCFQPIEISLDVVLDVTASVYDNNDTESCPSKIYFNIQYNTGYFYDIHTLIKNYFTCLPEISIECLLTHVSFLAT